MMTYRTVKLALQNLLGTSSLGNFRVIGFQRQAKSADEVLNADRLVQVYYTEGDFTKSANRNKGPKTHDVTFQIDLTCSAKAQADLTVLESSTATEMQKANAIAGLKEAAEIADEKADELIDRVWNILYDARNYDLGLPKGTVSSRWINQIMKDTGLERGDLVVKTANMKFTCRLSEEVLGNTGEYDPDNPPKISSNVPAYEDEGTGVDVEVSASS